MEAASPLAIRRGSDADIDALVDFQEAMAMESEGKHLDRARLRAGVKGLLARPQAGWYVVATREDVCLGSLMITPEWSDWRNGWWWWIQSVYVAPAGRRRGVYSALYAQVRAEAEAALDVIGLRLYVDKGNAGAIETYERLGMDRTNYHFYETSV